MGRAGDGAAADLPATPEVRAAVVASAINALNEEYIFPEKAEEMGRHIALWVMRPEEKARQEQADNEEMRSTNHGFRKVEILPGNVGSVDLRIFDSPRRAAPTAELTALPVDEVVEDVGHTQWVFTMPKMLRVYVLHHRELLSARRHAQNT